MLNHLIDIIKDHFLRIRVALIYLNLWRCEDRADFFKFKDILLYNYYANKADKLKEKLDRLTTK